MYKCLALQLIVLLYLLLLYYYNSLLYFNIQLAHVFSSLNYSGFLFYIRIHYMFILCLILM